MLPSEIVPGLLRWTARHPAWDGETSWGPMVGCVLYEVGGTVVLIDPLLPAEGREAFLLWLDHRVDGRPVSVLTTIHWHARDRDEVAERYRANSSRVWNFVPPGVQSKPLRGAGETLFWLPDVATLVPGDRLLGAPDGGLQLCPEDWLSSVRVDRLGLAGLIRPLIELPIERVLVSHGEPVLEDGRAALAQALHEVDGL